jgi:hypothetical protein
MQSHTYDNKKMWDLIFKKLWVYLQMDVKGRQGRKLKLWLNICMWHLAYVIAQFSNTFPRVSNQKVNALLTSPNSLHLMWHHINALVDKQLNITFCLPNYKM